MATIATTQKWLGCSIRSHRFLALMGALCLLLSAPQALAVKVSTVALMPARALSMERGIRVAVVPLTEAWQGGWGTNNENLVGAAISTALSNITVDGKGYFDVLDRSQALTIIQSEQELRGSALTDLSSFPELGGVLAVQYVVSGNARYSKSENWIQKEWERCSSRNSDGKCISKSYIALNCQEMEVQVNFYPKITEVRTGRITYRNKFEAAKTVNGCFGPPRKNLLGLLVAGELLIRPFDYASRTRIVSRSSPLELVDDVLTRAVAEFMKDIAPYPQTVELYLHNGAKFKSVADKKMRKFLKKKLKYARKQAKHSLHAACEVFAEIEGEEGAANEINLAFNLGVCAEFSGDYSVAEQYYSGIAGSYRQRLKSSPKWLANAQARLDERVAHRKKLAAQLAESEGAAPDFE